MEDIVERGDILTSGGFKQDAPFLLFGSRVKREKGVWYPFGDPKSSQECTSLSIAMKSPYLNNPNKDDAYSRVLRAAFDDEVAFLNPCWSIVEVSKMQRNLYNVIVLNHEDGAVLLDKKVVADSSPHALAKCDVVSVLKEKGLELHQVEECIILLGQMREVQEVKTDNVKF